MQRVVDFLASSGGRVRILTIMDTYSRRCMAAYAARSISGARVTRIIDTLAEKHGYPSRIITDNGPEFASRAMLAWSRECGVEIDYIQPGRPVQNAHIESFNGRLRDECLNLGWYRSIGELQRSRTTGEPITTTGARTARSEASRRTDTSNNIDRNTPSPKTRIPRTRWY